MTSCKFQVANAQLTELNLTQNLTGNAATDAGTVTMLDTNFAGGVKQNMKNMQDVGLWFC